MKLKIYKASAGSGKTHILAGNYLLSAFDSGSPVQYGDVYKAFSGDMAFSRILAVTFTNKAAGEMKTRIIKELDKLITGEKSDYIKDLRAKYPKLTEEAVRAKAAKIRSAVLHNYSMFNLRTIDSFVNRIVRAFCYDINVNSGFRIETDENVVVADLCDMLYQQLDNDSQLREQLLQLSRQNVDEGKNWDFRSQITNLAKLIFTENFKKLEDFASLKDDYQRKEYFAQAAKKIIDIYDSYVSLSKSIAKRATDIFTKIFNDYNSTPGELFKDVKTIYNFLTVKLLSTNYKDLDIASTKTFTKILNNPDGYLAKSKPTAIQKALAPVLFAQINPLLQEYNELYTNQFSNFVTAAVVRSDFYAFALLGDLAALLPQYRQDNQMMLVSDATAFLNEIVKDNDAPFIYERTGNKFDHIFIDEFQDTSEFQWQNFRPLIENTIAQGFDDMIVGDVKQSIYRFRGGDWTLLNSEVERSIGSENILFKTLDSNWRSRKNIVDFNNAVFANSVTVLEQHSDDEDLNFELLHQIYADSFQNLPQNQDRKGGNVKVKFFEKPKKEKSKSSDTDTDSDEEDESFDVTVLTAMAQDIDALLKQRYPAKKICVLIRKKAEAEKVVNFLLSYMNQAEDAEKYQVISADSLYIANSEPVKVAINAIKLVVNSEDSIAKAKLLQSYAKLSAQDITDDDIFKAVSNDAKAADILPDGFKNLATDYASLPLFDLCEKIISEFELYKYTGETEYLRTFEDTVLDFSRVHSSDVSRFVKWWDESGCKVSIQPSDNQNAVTVMTVHKSKGLDFGAVFMPFCNWKMEDVVNTSPTYIWVAPPEESDFGFLPMLPVRYSSALKHSVFRDYYHLEKRNMYVDALNILYVAFTRAVDELYVYSPKPSGDKIKNVGDLLYFCINQSIASDEGKIIGLSSYFNEDTLQLTLNTDHQVLTPGFKENAKKFEIRQFKNLDWNQKLSIKYNADDFFAKSNPFIQERINYGSFMHDVMSRIETAADLPIVLQQLKDQGRITEQQKEELRQKIETAFEIPEVKRWFSPVWKQIITETALLTLDGRIRIPDRVMVSDTETVIIDFKFGGHHPEYHDQIKEYAALLSSMKTPLYPNVSAYLFYVETNEIERVV